MKFQLPCGRKKAGNRFVISCSVCRCGGAVGIQLLMRSTA